MPSGPVRPQPAPGARRTLTGRAIPHCPACGGLLATHLHGSEQVLIAAAIAVMGLWASGWVTADQLWWLVTGFALLAGAVLLYQRVFLKDWPRYKRHEESGAPSAPPPAAVKAPVAAATPATPALPVRWQLGLGAQTIANIDVTGFEFPWHHGVLVDSPRFDDYRVYFQDDEEWPETPAFEALCQRIREQGDFHITDTATGERFARITLNHDGETVWFRVS